MAPLPEKLAKVASDQDALAHYTEAAKAHNSVLAENQRLKQRLVWFKRQMFGTRSEKLQVLAPEQQALLELLLAAEEQSPVAAVEASPPEAPSPAVKSRTRARATGGARSRPICPASMW